MSLKLKFFAPKVCAPPNNGLEGGKSRRYPQGPGHGGGCIAANGEDSSMIVLLVGRVTAPIGRLGTAGVVNECRGFLELRRRCGGVNARQVTVY